ncbi:purine-cytosine permease family protein [Oryzobacter terrae]|uniref:purine-cytosine permease family protein n=1 Tax=Oryzobacter terrae TaxID=1620385 RepID=UPI00366B6643
MDGGLIEVGKEAGHETRVNKWSLTMAWWALFSAMFWLYVSTASSAAYGAKNTLIGMVLATVTFGIINRVLAAYALRTRATVERLSSALFGTVGATVATLLIAATALYYAVFEGSIIALTLQDWFGGNLKVWYAVCVIYAVPLAFGGVRNWLDRLNGFLLPFYCVGLIALVIASTVRQGYPTGWLSVPAAATEVPGWLGAFLIYMGIWVMMLFTIDFASLGREEDTKFHQRVTFGSFFYFCTFIINGLVGMYIVSAFGVSGTETGVVQAVTGSLGFLGVLLVVISQTRINTANYFLASNNFATFIQRVFGVKLPHIAWVALCGVLAYSFMLTDVLNYLLEALAWQGVLIIAWTGVALVHALTNGRSDTVEGLERRTPRAGLGIAWALASVVGLVTLQLDGSPTIKTLSPVFTVVISVAIAYVVSRQSERQGAHEVAEQVS